jgi:hypothetical protein
MPRLHRCLFETHVVLPLSDILETGRTCAQWGPLLCVQSFLNRSHWLQKVLNSWELTGELKGEGGGKCQNENSDVISM